MKPDKSSYPSNVISDARLELGKRAKTDNKHTSCRTGLRPHVEKAERCAGFKRQEFECTWNHGQTGSTDGGEPFTSEGTGSRKGLVTGRGLRFS